MTISQNDWNNYIERLSRLSRTAGQLLRLWVEKNGLEDTNALIEYAYAVVTKYGEGSAEMACLMYDAVAIAQKAGVEAAVPAATATIDEVARAINGSLKQSPTGKLIEGVGQRLVKQPGVDTTVKNAIRDRAQLAWIPSGDTCAFCITLASRGWQYASNDLLKRGHAEHVHAHCDCQHAVRFNDSMNVKGYDPQKYLDMYNSHDGSPQDKINAMRREMYAEKLSQRKNNQKVNITDVAINKVKAVEINGYSKEQQEKIRLMNTKILKTAKEQNNSNEVVMLLNNFEISKAVLGDEKGVNIKEDAGISSILRNSPLRSIVLSHNHPSSSYFSADDIGIFLQYPSIKTMEVVTNSGKTWYINKNNKYDDIEAFRIYHNIIKENPGRKLDEIVDIFLREMYSSIERLTIRNSQ